MSQIFFRRTKHRNDTELSERIGALFEEEYRDWHPAQGQNCGERPISRITPMHLVLSHRHLAVHDMINKC